MDETAEIAKHRVLKEVFGFEYLRPGQERVIDAVLAGRSVLSVMPTGAGKSLCFQVPALVLGGLTVVVSPLVALMQDQVAALRLAGVAAETINSSRDYADNAATWRRVAKGEVRILYLSPERLMTERMLAAMARLPISLFAIDEAHCIAQWGPAFRKEYADLERLKTLFPDVPIAAFTATADRLTREEIADKLFAGQPEIFVAGFDRPNIRLAVTMKRQWKRQLLAFLEHQRGESGIVYCLSRRKTEEAAALLREAGIAALPYHAGMEKEARSANQDAFITETGRVMVATIAFGMGIDKADVRFVFHCDLPGSLEAYYQEIGRAGRDGQPAEAAMLYGLDDLRMRRVFIEEEKSDDEARKRREHKRLDALIGYCEAPACRRRTLLAYFGEDHGACGNCDNCLDPPELVEGSEEGRMALSAVLRTGQRFGAAHLIDVLRGRATERAVKLGHDKLPTFGVGEAHSSEAWRSILRQLVAAGFLHLDIAGYGGLKVTLQGSALVKGEASFRYRRDSVPATAKRCPAAAAATDGPPPPPADASLLAHLKARRLEIARARGVPAFVIFSDRTLEEMAGRRPRDREAFAALHGVGKVKLEDLAEPFLAAIAEWQDPPPT